MENYAKRKWSGPFVDPDSDSLGGGILFCLVNGNDFLAVMVSFESKMIAILLGNKKTQKNASLEFKND